jgi:hypothetical protein
MGYMASPAKRLSVRYVVAKFRVEPPPLDVVRRKAPGESTAQAPTSVTINHRAPPRAVLFGCIGPRVSPPQKPIPHRDAHSHPPLHGEMLEGIQAPLTTEGSITRGRDGVFPLRWIKAMVADETLTAVVLSSGLRRIASRTAPTFTRLIKRPGRVQGFHEFRPGFPVTGLGSPPITAFAATCDEIAPEVERLTAYLTAQARRTYVRPAGKSLVFFSASGARDLTEGVAKVAAEAFGNIEIDGKTGSVLLRALHTTAQVVVQSNGLSAFYTSSAVWARLLLPPHSGEYPTASFALFGEGVVTQHYRS